MGRPEKRERLLEHSRRVGVAEMRDEEIYESLLTFCAPSVAQKSRDLGTRLCGHMNGFERFTAVSLSELERIADVSRETAEFLSVTARVCARAEEEREASRFIDSPAAAAKYIAPKLRFLDREAALLLCLTDDLRCEQCRFVGEGGAFSTQAGTFPIVSAAFNSGTHIVILAHNHVVGGPEPSDADVMVTQSLLHSLKNAGITLLDHIVVSGVSYVSMAAHGDFRGETEPERQIYCPCRDTDAEGTEA